MKHSYKLLIGAALMLPAAAMAAKMEGPMGSVAVYATNTSLNVPALPDNDAKHTGFGVKGWYSFGIPFVHAEYQTATVGDDVTNVKVKVKQLRLGGGAAIPVSPEVLVIGKLEYVKQDYGNNQGCECDLKGPGIHAGAMFMPMPALHLGATVGYLKLSGDANNGPGDTKGVEYNLGAGYNFTKEWGAFLDYRKFNGKFDNTNAGDTKWDVTDIRLGGTFTWGG